MATGPEHYAEAERILDHAEENAERYSDTWYLAAVMAAQVHATLAAAAATVDAQRGGTAVWESWPTTPPKFTPGSTGEFGFDAIGHAAAFHSHPTPAPEC
jgi:hypothetical protein